MTQARGPLVVDLARAYPLEVAQQSAERRVGEGPGQRAECRGLEAPVTGRLLQLGQRQEAIDMVTTIHGPPGLPQLPQ